MLKGARLVWLFLFQIRPDGLASIRFLCSQDDDRIRKHRLLWGAGRGKLPKYVWWSAQAMCLVRWWLIGVWRIDSSAWARPSDRLRWGMGWGLTPQDIAVVREICPNADMLDYVHVNETKAYHFLRNKDFANVAATGKLLQDKVATEHALQPFGVPVVKTLRILPQGISADLGEIVPEHGHLFCKARSLNRGRGAFEVWKQGGVIVGRDFRSKDQIDSKSVRKKLNTLLRLDDALVQPCLTNHRTLSKISRAREAATVRCITRQDGESASVHTATLEIPAGETWRYSIAFIDVSGGKLLANPGWFRDDEGVLHQCIKDGFRVPFWADIAKHSIAAHHCLGPLWAIAFDWIVTDSGPILLEANSNFGLAELQAMHGGLLRASEYDARRLSAV